MALLLRGAACACVGRGRNPRFVLASYHLRTQFTSPSLPPSYRRTFFTRHQIRAKNAETKVEPMAFEEVGDQLDENWKTKMLYDGECPLCMREAMGRIHAILADGTVVTDVEAFRKLYEEVGLGWVYAITKYELIATVASAVYRVWARYHLEITGRPSLENVMEARRKNRGEVCNDKKSCDISELINNRRKSPGNG